MTHVELMNLDGDLAYCLQENTVAGIAPEDITGLIAEIVGENDGASWAWIVTLVSGQFGALTGWCDYTGWDCRSGASGAVFDKARDAARWCAESRSDNAEQDNDELIAQLLKEKPVGGRMEHIS